MLLCTAVWFLTLRDEHGSMMLKHTELTKIWRPKREEVPEGWRKLQNEDFYGLYFSLNNRKAITTRKIRWVGNAVHMTEENAYKVLVGKPERKRPGRPRCRREDIKIILKKLRCKQTRFM